ncbi:hypothetical protein FQA47_015454 [Oryzias melastigma]|uniref:Uncharacterized protein n=2 Tax=Oryzias melastigma TaxID=30732 RepID=A0A834FQA7_ORYME|nr:hypothetical protein FQA47_015454 [Oryzias melastigma]
MPRPPNVPAPSDAVSWQQLLLKLAASRQSLSVFWEDFVGRSQMLLISASCCRSSLVGADYSSHTWGQRQYYSSRVHASIPSTRFEYSHRVFGPS